MTVRDIFNDMHDIFERWVLLAGILAVLTVCWIRYADVDKHVERLPRRLWKLATRPVRFAKKVHGEAKQKRAAKARRRQ